MSRKWLRRIGLTVLVLLIVGAAGFVIWAGTPAGALMPAALTALESDSTVTVTTEPWLTFTPDEPASTAFIFYPGGRVLPEAYAPGSREEAICFAEDVRAAWAKHPAALKWLTAQKAK